MFEAPTFTFCETADSTIVIERGSATTRDLIFEITRQAIGLARRNSKPPLVQGLPEDEELEPILTHLEFPQDREFEVINHRNPHYEVLVGIDYLDGLAVKFSLRAPTGVFAHISEPLIFLQRPFDTNHGQGSSLHVLRMAMMALEIRNLAAPPG